MASPRKRSPASCVVLAVLLGGSAAGWAQPVGQVFGPVAVDVPAPERAYDVLRWALGELRERGGREEARARVEDALEDLRRGFEAAAVVPDGAVGRAAAAVARAEAAVADEPEVAMIAIAEAMEALRAPFPPEGVPLAETAGPKAGEWRAAALIEGALVQGPVGDDLGAVEDLLLAGDGRVLALVAEIGGVAGLGGTRIVVPWEQVALADRGDRVVVPVSEDDLAEYESFAVPEYVAGDAPDEVRTVPDELIAGPTVWKASELIGRRIEVDGRPRAIADLAFEGGRLRAVLLGPS